MKFLKGKLLWIIIIVAVIGIGLFVSMQDKSLKLETSTAKKGNISQFIIEDGKVILLKDYYIAMPLNGKIHPFPFMEGDLVKKGDKLASLDIFDKNQQLKSLQFRLQELDQHLKSVDIVKPKKEDIESAKIRVEEVSLRLKQLEQKKQISKLNLEHLEQNYLRQKKLFENKVTTKAQFDEIKNRLEITRKELQSLNIEGLTLNKSLKLAKLSFNKTKNSIHDNEYQRKVYLLQKQQLQTKLNILKNDLLKSEIISPISGPVLEIYIKNEKVIPAGTNIMRIGDLGSIIIEADILSEEISQIVLGQKVVISGKVLGTEEISGKVSRVYPSGFTKISALGVEQQRVKINIKFDNKIVKLIPGTKVDLKIITNSKKETIIIPEKALFKNEGKWFVFVVKNDLAKLKEITIGLKNDDFVEITKGIIEGDIIITETDNKLADGIKIIHR